MIIVIKVANFACPCESEMILLRSLPTPLTKNKKNTECMELKILGENLEKLSLGQTFAHLIKLICVHLRSHHITWAFLNPHTKKKLSSLYVFNLPKPSWLFFFFYRFFNFTLFPTYFFFRIIKFFIWTNCISPLNVEGKQNRLCFSIV